MDRKTTTVKRILEKVKSREISAEEGHRLIQEGERDELSISGSELVYSSPEWRQSSCQPVSVPVGDILVFDATGELYAELQQAWAQRERSQVRWVRVSPGNAYSVEGDHYHLQLDDAEDYARLLAELQDQGFRLGLIIHAWSEGAYAPEMLGEHLERSVGSVYQLSRALLQHKQSQPVEVQYVYRNQEGVTSPVYAGLSGFARTVRLEAPHYRYKVIELGQASAEAADQLLSEWGQQDEVHIRYSADGRAIRKLIEQTPAPINSVPWRTGGVYLIIGGLGGIGQQLAAHLLSNYKAQLVLTGRRELDETQRARLDQLRSLGGDVLYLRADVGERENVERLVASIKARHGALHGIVHAAGVLRDSFLLKKSKEELQAVFKPKVWGTVWLDEATRDEPLELFVLFSSGAAVMGNVGQADYAYANAFQDHYAHWRAARGGSGKSLSVNWPLWAEGGMEITAEAKAHMWNELGVLPLRTSSALQALEDGLRLKATQFMPLEGNREKILATLWGAEAAPAKSRVSADETVGVDETFRPRVEAYLKEILSQEIKLPAERIEVHEPFENYGIDSVVIVNLNRELENHFGELPKTLFFEYPNLHKLAVYFMDHLGAELRHKLGSTESESPARKLPARPLPNNAAAKVRHARFMADATGSHGSEVTDIAIIGLGGRYPKARDLTTFWQNLQAGRDCIEEIPATRWDYRDYFDNERGQARQSYSKWGGFIDDVDKFDPLFFNIAPRDAEWIDPQERLFLQTVWQTVEDAGYTRERLGSGKVGVFVGVMYGEYQLFSVDQDDSPVLSASYASIANRVSYFFDFHGPSIAVDTMCSSSLTSLHLACESIRHGECEYAVAGGVNLLLHPLKYLQLSRGRFISTDGRCRAFGESGDGYVPGEGVGAVLLKSLSQAVADGDSIHGVIRATAVNHGGKTNGYTVPNPNAQAGVISDALQRSGIEAGSISYVEAHGTGTALGDPIEIGGLAKAYGGQQKQSCAIGSVKSNIGHLESAAGIAGLTKVLLQMKYRTLVPSLHAEQENPNIKFKDTPFRVQREVTEWKRPEGSVAGETRVYPRRAGISSFGAGGSNAHVIIEEYEGPNREAEISGEQLVLLSARTEERLKAYAKELACYLERVAGREDAPQLAEIAYTLQVGREAMDERLALVVSDLQSLQQKLEAFLAGKTDDGTIERGNVLEPRVSTAFLEGEEAAAFVRALTQSQNLQKVAQLWVAGARFEWAQFWQLGAPMRVSLPAYPFAGDRYWAPGAPKNMSVVSAKPPAQFDRIDFQASLEEGIVFEKQLDSGEPTINDHQVNGRRVFPGVGQLLLAVAAAKAAGLDGAVLRRVVWRQPLVVEDSGVLVRVHLCRAGGETRFAISSQRGDQWLTHAEGEITMDAANLDHDQLPIAECWQKIRPQVESAALYNQFSEQGLQYGPHYQVIETLRCAQDEVLARLVAASPIAFFDGGLQAIAGLGIAHSTVSAAGLPFSVEEVRIVADQCAAGYAYARPVEGGRFDVVLADDSKRVVAELRGIYLRPVPVAANASSSVDEQRSSVAPSVRSLILDSSTEPSVTEEHTKSYVAVEYFFRCLLLDVFRRLGAFESASERHEISVLQNQLGVLPDYTRLYDSLLDILEQEGWIRRDGIFVTATIAAVDPEIDRMISDAEQKKKALEDTYPEMKAHIDLLWACLRAYPDVLTGRRTATEVMFPQGSKALVENVYRGNELTDRYNRAVADLIARYVSASVAQDPSVRVRILEIGAGTGGSSAFVLPALRPHSACVEYFYTDVSASFTHHGRKMFGDDYPFMEFVTLDIESDSLEQDFQPGSVDLVFASNVLHATRRIDDTLHNVRSLLKTGGLIVVNELTCVEDFATLTFGLTEGWWRFEDEALRLKGGPLLGADRWVERLNLAGFTQTQVVSIGGTEAQSVLLAEAQEQEPEQEVLSMPSDVLANDMNEPASRYKNEIVAESVSTGVALDYVKDVFAQVLKVDKVHIRPEQTFDKYGVDSLLALDLIKRFEQDLDKLPSTLLFEYPTAVALAEYISEQRKEKLARLMVGTLYEEAQRTVCDVEHTLDVPSINATVNVMEHNNLSGTESMQSKASANSDLQADLNVRALDYVKDVFARILKASKNDIRPELTFDKLGVDSLLVLDITKELEQDLGKLPPTLLFEYTTARALANHFVEHLREPLQMTLGGAVETCRVAEDADVAPTSVSSTSEQRLRGTERSISDEHEVAIVGVSGRYPGADNLDEFWDNLCQGRDSIGEIPSDRWDWREFYDPQSKGVIGRSYTKWGGFLKDVDKFDPMFFSMLPVEAEVADPQERIFLETVWALFEEAGITRNDLASLDHSVGVFVGVMNNHYVRHGGNSAYWSIANRVSYFFNLNGPSMAIDSACSSSLTALHLACESIRRGECRAAVVGGVNIIAHPAHYLGLSAAGMLSAGDTCRSFGEGADGFVDGEGVGAVLLKTLKQALIDGDHVYGVVKGSFVNAGGRTGGYTVPNPNAQAKVVKQALQRSGIDPRTIGYIEAHGTGTALGDPIEISGLAKAFQAFTDEQQFCAIGSVKSNIGHLESAAGISGLTKLLLQLRHKRLVPSLHSRKLNPHIDFQNSPFYVQQELAEWNQFETQQNGIVTRYPRRAGISSFGAGGANAHVIIEEYEMPRRQISAQREHLIVLSARDEDRLKAYAHALLGYLERCIESALDLAEVAYTLQAGREAMEERLALLVSSPEVLREKLKVFLLGDEDGDIIHSSIGAGREKAELLIGGRAGSEFLRIVAQDRDLPRLAQLWVWGVEADWSLLYPDGVPSRIPLPTYPFARERYWMSQSNSTSVSESSSQPIDKPVQVSENSQVSEASSVVENDEADLLEDMIYVPRWEAQSLPDSAANAARIDRALIVHAGNAEALVSELRVAHHEVFEIVLGERTGPQGERCWEVALEDVDAYGRILSEIGLVDTIYHLGGIGFVEPLELAQLSAGQERGVISLFRLVKALAGGGYGSQRLLLKVVTTGVYRVREQDVTSPYGAGLHGFVQSMTKEYPDWQATCIDLGEADGKNALPGILAEPGGLNGASIALRDGVRYWRNLYPAALPTDGEMPLRPGGVYLIVGGGRGIGLEFAKYLAAEAQAKVVLVGRSELDTARNREFESIRAAGGEVLYLRADATNAAQMRQVVAEVKARYGCIDGAVHSALVLRDRSLNNMTEQELREALAPKVEGSIGLLGALEGEDLDFVLFLSSAQSFAANPGQSNYAAGCTFKDAFADALRARCKRPEVRVINWGYWGNVGAAAGEEYGKRMAAFGIGSIESCEGIETIRRVLSSKVPQVLAFKGTRQVLEAIGVDYSQGVMQCAKREAVSTPHEVIEHESVVVGDLGKRLKTLFADQLKLPLEKINEDKLFADYGIDSILSVMLVKKLEEQLGRKIEPVALINHPTLRALCSYLEGQPAAADAEQKAAMPVIVPEAGAQGLLPQLKAQFADQLKLPLEKIDEDKLFADYGIDSILSVMLVKKLEEQLGRKIEPVALINHPTLRALSDYLAGLSVSAGTQTAELGSVAPGIESLQSADAQVQSEAARFRMGPSYVRRIKASLERNGDLDAKIQILEQTLDRSSSSFWSLSILAYFQSIGLLINTQAMTRDQLRGAMGVSPSYEYLFEALLRVLSKNELITVDTDRVNLTDKGRSSETQRCLESLPARRELLARTTPEMESLADLFECCLSSLNEILSRRLDPAALLCSDENRTLLNNVYQGENRLSAIVNAVVSKGLEGFGERLRSGGSRKVRVLELGPSTLSGTSSLFDSLRECSNGIDHYFTGVSGVLAEMKVALGAQESPFVNFHAIDLEDVERVASRRKFDIVWLQLPLQASDHLEQCVQLAGQVVRKNGIVLLSDLAEADPLAFTLGLMDPSWTFGVSLATEDRSPREAVDNTLRILKEAGMAPSEVLGRWLISGSSQSQNSPIFALNLPDKIAQLPRMPMSEGLIKHTLLTSGQRTVEYSTCGQGEPVIFLTAMAFVSSIWRNQIEAFGERYQLILPHLPGHGGSTFNGESFTFEDLADDLVDILDQLGIESAHLVGWCMAGNIGQLLAARYPNRLRSLTLICTTPTDAGARGLDGDDLAVYSDNPLMSYELEFQNIYRESFYDNPVIEDYLALIRHSHTRIESEAVLYYVSNLFSFDALGVLKDIHVPTLVMSGKWDIAFPPDQVKLLQDGIQGAKYFEFTQSGHMPFLNESETFNKVFEEFIKSVVMTAHSDHSEEKAGHRSLGSPCF